MEGSNRGKGGVREEKIGGGGVALVSLTEMDDIRTGYQVIIKVITSVMLSISVFDFYGLKQMLLLFSHFAILSPTTLSFKSVYAYILKSYMSLLVDKR
jgi:hypothetical protein